MYHRDYLVLLLLEQQLACFVQSAQRGWRHVALDGETWRSLSSHYTLRHALAELDQHINRSDQLARFELQLIYDHASLAQLDCLSGDLASVGCSTWQVLRWEPLRERAGGASLPPQPEPKCLLERVLPLLESTFHYQDSALAMERAHAQQQHQVLVQQLEAERAQLKSQLTELYGQVRSLQQPSVYTLVSYLPALYRQVFSIISPHDLALLAGSLEVPEIPSPWPEPSADTLLTKQAQLRQLPTAEAQRLRDFCQQLSHRLEPRKEMRAWLEQQP